MDKLMSNEPITKQYKKLKYSKSTKQMDGFKN